MNAKGWWVGNTAEAESPLTFRWRSVDVPLTFRWRSVDVPLTFRWHSVDFPLTFRWRSVDFPLTFRWRFVGWTPSVDVPTTLGGRRWVDDVAWTTLRGRRCVNENIYQGILRKLFCFRGTPFKNDIPTSGWWKNFLRRHPQLRLRTPSLIDPGRSSMSSASVLNRFFSWCTPFSSFARHSKWCWKNI